MLVFQCTGLLRPHPVSAVSGVLCQAWSHRKAWICHCLHSSTWISPPRTPRPPVPHRFGRNRSPHRPENASWELWLRLLQFVLPNVLRGWWSGQSAPSWIDCASVLSVTKWEWKALVSTGLRPICPFRWWREVEKLQNSAVFAAQSKRGKGSICILLKHYFSVSG